MQTLHRDNYTVDEWDDICKRFGVSNTCLSIDIDEDEEYDSSLDDFEDYMYNNEYDDDFDDMTDDEDCKWVE
jgi:hypothetical protein